MIGSVWSGCEFEDNWEDWTDGEGKNDGERITSESSE